MLHAITANPDVQAAFNKFLVDLLAMVGTVLGIVLVQVGNAVKESHLNLIQKLVAEKLVAYAEQTITTDGEGKARYVAAQLKEKFPKLDDTEVQHLMEAAVLNVKAQVNAPPKGA